MSTFPERVSTCNTLASCIPCSINLAAPGVVIHEHRLKRVSAIEMIEHAQTDGLGATHGCKGTLKLAYSQFELMRG